MGQVVKGPVSGRAPWGFCPVKKIEHAGGLVVCKACGAVRPNA